MCRPLREQAHSHRIQRRAKKSRHNTDPLWERACSRKRRVRRRRCRMGCPLREQAHSHKIRRRAKNPGTTQIHCGSGLARESAGSGGCDAECDALFVSKLTPTRFGGVQKNPGTTQIHCGSEPARESAGSGGCDVGWAALFVSKLTPTRFGGVQRISAQHRSTVGASLLAKAPGQAKAMLDVPPSS